jgi:hypothetical protein
MKKTILAALAASICLPSLAFAYGAAGSVSAPYLEVPMGARGEGMGEAFTGVADDVNAIYYNAAGLTTLETAQLELMHMDSFGGVQYENLGLAVPTDALGLHWWGTVGLNYTLVGIDDTPNTRENPDGSYDTTWANFGYTFNAGASVVALSYAWQATKLYSVGATLKIINEQIATAQGWGFAGDVALMTRPELIKGLSAGLTLQNIGSAPEAGAPLPGDLRMGVGYLLDHPFTGIMKADKLTFDIDLVMPVVPVVDVWQMNFGAEYTRWFNRENASLRVGYQVPTESQLDGFSGFTAGGGLGVHLDGLDLSLDYAWVPFGILGNTDRFSLTANFGAKARPIVDLGPKGNWLFPPPNVAAVSGDRYARITWEAPKGTVDGYNLYMTYNPASNKWTRLNKAPIQTLGLTVNSLYNGYKVYFAVSTLGHKAGYNGVYRESDKSPSVMVVPRRGGY